MLAQLYHHRSYRYVLYGGSTVSLGDSALCLGGTAPARPWVEWGRGAAPLYGTYGVRIVNRSTLSP